MDSTSIFRSDVFSGRVCGVTGGAHGIGEGAIRLLAAMGASVVILDVDEGNLHRVERDLRDSNADALCLCGDVTDAAYLEDAFGQIERRWGRLDGWVNNVKCNFTEPVEARPLVKFTRVWEVNVLTAMRAAQLGLPLMKRAGAGSIVNISSVLAHRMNANHAAYSSAKSAMEGLTRAMAVELAGDFIRVNAIAPGAIQTTSRAEGSPTEAAGGGEAAAATRPRGWPQPLPRTGTPADTAGAIAFLLSDAAAFITGVTLPVDGGFLVERTRWQRSKEKQR